MRGQLEEAREQFTMLDVEHTKAVNRCEVLATLNLSLEEDRKNLMSQVRCSEEHFAWFWTICQSKLKKLIHTLFTGVSAADSVSRPVDPDNGRQRALP